MKCQLCSNEGSIFFTKMENNKLQQFCYCQNCAEKKGILETELLSTISTFLNETIAQAEEKSSKGIQSLFECPVCRFTLEDWRRTQRLGCARCYDIFRPDLTQKLDEIQEEHTHTGKKPIQKQLRQLKLIQKKQLQQLLETAVSREDYEQAARIRDMLNVI